MEHISLTPHGQQQELSAQVKIPRRTKEQELILGILEARSQEGQLKKRSLPYIQEHHERMRLLLVNDLPAGCWEYIPHQYADREALEVGAVASVSGLRTPIGGLLLWCIMTEIGDAAAL